MAATKTDKMLKSLEVQGMRNRVRKLNRSMVNQDIKSYASHMSVESQWSTTNKEMYKPHEIRPQVLSLQRANWKRRTPFTDWSNAYFGNGVFFNPPVSGI